MRILARSLKDPFHFLKDLKEVSQSEKCLKIFEDLFKICEGSCEDSGL